MVKNTLNIIIFLLQDRFVLVGALSGAALGIIFYNFFEVSLFPSPELLWLRTTITLFCTIYIGWGVGAFVSYYRPFKPHKKKKHLRVVK